MAQRARARPTHAVVDASNKVHVLASALGARLALDAFRAALVFYKELAARLPVCAGLLDLDLGVDDLVV